MFVHLNVHSVYSEMRSTLSINNLMDLAQSHHKESLALTDVNTIRGFIHFVHSAKDRDIAPIAGVNLITNIDEAVILAENRTGYENICRLITDRYNNPDRSVAELIRQRYSGLFILTYQSSLIKRLRSFIPDTHLFIELRPGVKESVVQKLSKIYRLEIVATGDVYFKDSSDSTSHRVLRAINNNTTLKKLKKEDYKDKRHWFRNESDMVHLFPNSLDAINNSHYLAQRCKRKWSFVNTIFPGLSLKDTYRSNKKLRDYAYQGAIVRYTILTDKIKQRIEYEINLIIQKGFAPYFLIVRDIVSRTRATIGRGSAAASIVSYCLFITQVDPLRYNLIFDRFIHPERSDMPDIDIDFPWDERDDILDYVFKKYGNKRTAMVSNQVFLKPRSAIREVGKVFGLSNEQINSVTKRIHWMNNKKELKKWIESDDRFSDVDLNGKYREVLENSEKIIGAFRYVSVHPGGIIIVPDEICKYVPVLKAPKGVQIVEWEKDQVENSGLLKIDLLGNRSLAVVRDTIRQVNIYYSTGSDRYLDYHKIQPIEDKKTKSMMMKGMTIGVFYIESPATRQLMAKARVVDFENIVIFSSIIRPAANRFTNLMLERIHGKNWSLLHPDLEFLNESYGIMVYEEQVSMAAMKMAGLGYAEADILRKTMTRNSDMDKINFWKNKFFSGAINRGYDLAIIKKVWDMIASFVGYSFCKPHSASYAMLSFTCAYLKAHFTAEFISSVISNQGGYYSAYAYMSEARRLGVIIKTPDINESYYEWRGTINQIRMGFMSIKRLKNNAVKRILEQRKFGLFESLDDFLFRVDMDLSDAMALTNAQCFNSICQSMNHREIAYIVAEFYLNDKSEKPVKTAPTTDKLTQYEVYQIELEVFGYPISVHPLELYRPMLSKRIGYAKDIRYNVGKSVYLIGVYIASKETRTSNKQSMEFLTLEDETDIYECILFPSVFAEFGDMINWERLFIIYGKVEQSFGVCSVNINKIASLKEWASRNKSMGFS